MEGLVFIAGLAGFEILAARFGKTSRDGEDWVAHEDGPHLPVTA